MWINAFAAIRPSDALKMEIGDYILGKLASEDPTPGYFACDAHYC